MITCGRCGLQNAPDLRFCADCGARLAAPPSPVASATPPRGLRAAPQEVLASPPPSRAPQRPVAPPFNPPAVAVQNGVSPLSCRHCGTANSPEARFCTACGQPMLDDHAMSLPARQPEATVICPRCHGSCPLGTAFCQF